MTPSFGTAEVHKSVTGVARGVTELISNHDDLVLRRRPAKRRKEKCDANHVLTRG
jgi:hypothetical protein